ncbi:MAG: 30S ribosomal protein S20 [bacterium]
MPNLKASIKDVRKTKKRTVRNKAAISELKTTLKAARKLSDHAAATKALPKVISVIDKTLQRGIIKKNTAARYKSRITTFVNKLKK